MSLDVWYAIPSACPEAARKNLPLWKDMGYKVAVLQDRIRFDLPCADLIATPWDHYRGWPQSVNHLIQNHIPASVQIVVTGGDDMRPDPKVTAQEAAQLFLHHFPDTFGVMQPTGDDFPGTNLICGSPWLGRSLIQRLNRGTGPLWSQYIHFFADEELHNVAKSLGILRNEPSLCQYHDHWTRKNQGADEVHSILNGFWASDKSVHEFRKRNGYPNHEPLAHSHKDNV